MMEKVSSEKLNGDDFKRELLAMNLGDIIEAMRTALIELDKVEKENAALHEKIRALSK